MRAPEGERHAAPLHNMSYHRAVAVAHMEESRASTPTHAPSAPAASGCSLALNRILLHSYDCVV